MDDNGRIEVWDRHEKLTLVRPGQSTPSVLTLRRITRSLRMALIMMLPPHLSPPSASEYVAGLMVRAVIVAAENLTDAQTGELVVDTAELRARNVTLASEAVFDALSDLDIAMILGVADSLVPPSKVQAIAEEKLREARSLVMAVDGVTKAVQHASATARETLKGNS